MMNQIDTLKNLDELIGIAEAIVGTKMPSPPPVEPVKFGKWRMSSLNFLSRHFNESSLFFREFKEKCLVPQHEDAVEGLSILRAAKPALLSGQAEFTEEQPVREELNRGNWGTSEADPKKVFVVHGRNLKIMLEMFRFLRSLNLEPIEWTEAVKLTGEGSPYIGTILDAAFAHAQAVVVVMTPDDQAKLRQEFVDDNDPEHERNLTPQARPNVLFEAGLAFGRQPDRTILVEVGKLRPFSDIAGRHVIKMDNSQNMRNELAERLRTAGCRVDASGQDWLTEGDFEFSALAKSETSADKKEHKGETVISPFPTPVVLSEAAEGISMLRYMLNRGEELEPGISPSGVSQWGWPQMEYWTQQWLDRIAKDVWKYTPDQATYILSDEGMNIHDATLKYTGWQSPVAVRRVVFERRLGRLREVCSQIPDFHEADSETDGDE